jgi:hypothetical protein
MFFLLIKDNNGHVFCAICIQKWIKINSTCPIDRCQIEKLELKEIPLSMKNIIEK